MATFRKAFITAIVKSLLRGKSILQAILAFWVAPHAVQSRSSGSNSTSRSIERTKDVKASRTAQDFLKEAENLLLGPVGGDGLLELSANLKVQFRDRLQTNLACMLPSFSHKLPTGRECGQYLALDVGGSTLRVALVELRAGQGQAENQSDIVRIMAFKINQDVKNLEGMAFFDWMADRIVETISSGLKSNHSPTRPMLMSLAWSFPIEYAEPLNPSYTAVRILTIPDKHLSRAARSKAWAKASRPPTAC
jgi:hexokinase